MRTQILIVIYVIYILCWQVLRLLLYLLLNRADFYRKKLTEHEETQILIAFYVIYCIFYVGRCYGCCCTCYSYLKNLTRE